LSVAIANFATEKSMRQTWFTSIFELYVTISAYHPGNYVPHTITSAAFVIYGE
jgi:hypothetical protein